jgi:hypothetical protein
MAKAEGHSVPFRLAAKANSFCNTPNETLYFALLGSDGAPKRLQMLQEALPQLGRGGLLLNPNAGNAKTALSNTEAGRRLIGCSSNHCPLTALKRQIHPLSEFGDRNREVAVLIRR